MLRLLRVAIACIILVGLAPPLQASASGDPGRFSESLVQSALAPGLEADSHGASSGHGGADHCFWGSGCTSAALLPEAVALPIGRRIQTLTPADLSPSHRDIVPPLQPPNSASPG